MGLFVAISVLVILLSLVGLVWLFNSDNKEPKSKPFNRTLSRSILEMPCAHEWIEVCRHCGESRRRQAQK